MSPTTLSTKLLKGLFVFEVAKTCEADAASGHVSTWKEQWRLHLKPSAHNERNFEEKQSEPLLDLILILRAKKLFLIRINLLINQSIMMCSLNILVRPATNWKPNQRCSVSNQIK